jgi:hypothetical protein
MVIELEGLNHYRLSRPRNNVLFTEQNGLEAFFPLV